MCRMARRCTNGRRQQKEKIFSSLKVSLHSRSFVRTPALSRIFLTRVRRVPMENSPQVVFEKLFGDGGTSEQRLMRKKQDRSILDSIVEQTQGLQKGLPSSDRARIDGYLDDIREIERRIKLAEAQASSAELQ